MGVGQGEPAEPAGESLRGHVVFGVVTRSVVGLGARQGRPYLLVRAYGVMELLVGLWGYLSGYGVICGAGGQAEPAVPAGESLWDDGVICGVICGVMGLFVGLGARQSRPYLLVRAYGVIDGVMGLFVGLLNGLWGYLWGGGQAEPAVPAGESLWGY